MDPVEHDLAVGHAPLAPLAPLDPGQPDDEGPADADPQPVRARHLVERGHLSILVEVAGRLGPLAIGQSTTIVNHQDLVVISEADEGFGEIADWFETLARAEKSHAGRFGEGLKSIS